MTPWITCNIFFCFVHRICLRNIHLNKKKSCLFLQCNSQIRLLTIFTGFCFQELLTINSHWSELWQFGACGNADCPLLWCGSLYLTLEQEWNEYELSFLSSKKTPGPVQDLKMSNELLRKRVQHCPDQQFPQRVLDCPVVTRRVKSGFTIFLILCFMQP